MRVVRGGKSSSGDQDTERRPAERRESVDKNKALDAALSQIERAFGKGSIMRMGARRRVPCCVPFCLSHAQLTLMMQPRGASP